MFIRIKRVSGKGLVIYLITAKKKGRKYHRNQLDERVMIAGDIDAFDRAVRYTHQEKDWKNNRHVHHFTIGFSKRDEANIDIAKMRKIVSDVLKEYYHLNDLDELVYHAEAHIPKIKFVKDKSTNQMTERFAHIHLVVSQLNLSTDTQLIPLPFLEGSGVAINASIQTELARKHELDDPAEFPTDKSKDNEESIRTDLIERWKGQKAPVKQSVTASLRKYLQAVLKGVKGIDEIEALAGADCLVKSIRFVKTKKNKYYKTMLDGELMGLGYNPSINIRGKGFEHIDAIYQGKSLKEYLDEKKITRHSHQRTSEENRELIDRFKERHRDGVDHKYLKKRERGVEGLRSFWKDEVLTNDEKHALRTKVSAQHNTNAKKVKGGGVIESLSSGFNGRQGIQINVSKGAGKRWQSVVVRQFSKLIHLMKNYHYSPFSNSRNSQLNASAGNVPGNFLVIEIDPGGATSKKRFSNKRLSPRECKEILDKSNSSYLLNYRGKRKIGVASTNTYLLTIPMTESLSRNQQQYRKELSLIADRLGLADYINIDENSNLNRMFPPLSSGAASYLRNSGMVMNAEEIKVEAEEWYQQKQIDDLKKLLRAECDRYDMACKKQDYTIKGGPRSVDMERLLSLPLADVHTRMSGQEVAPESRVKNITSVGSVIFFKHQESGHWLYHDTTNRSGGNIVHYMHHCHGKNLLDAASLLDQKGFEGLVTDNIEYYRQILKRAISRSSNLRELEEEVKKATKSRFVKIGRESIQIGNRTRIFSYRDLRLDAEMSKIISEKSNIL